MAYITRTGYAILSKEELHAQAHPAPITEAADIPGFNFYALLREIDIRITGSLLYRPTVKNLPRWEAKAEYMGYTFHVNLYQEDIDFLNRVFGTDIIRKTFWRDMLPETLDIGIRYIDKKSRKPCGIKCVWDGSRVVYVDEKYNPFREGSPLAPAMDEGFVGTCNDTSGNGTSVTNGHGWAPWQATLHAAIERSLQAHRLLQAILWFPPERAAGERPRFIGSRGNAGD